MQANELLEHWPFSHWQHRRVLVGVSGGADSVALLCGLRELAEPDRLVAAHYNHGWRGPASDADEAFVVQLCQQLGVPCVIGHAPLPTPTVNQNDSDSSVNSAMLAKGFTSDSEGNVSVSRGEEAARAARYQFFAKSAYEHGASYVATAHTADDRIETLLHNLFRGTGLSGAASLKMFRPFHQDLVLVRPFIAKTRNHVLQYLAERQQPYCNDASNTDERYARNYVRHQVLPAIRQRYSDADSRLLNFSQLVEEALDDIRLLAERWLLQSEATWNRLLMDPSHASHPAIVAWAKDQFWCTLASAAAAEPWTVIREALRMLWLERNWSLGDMSRSHWETVRGLVQKVAEAPGAEQDMPQTLAILPGALAIETAGPYLAIGRRQPAQSADSLSGRV